MKYIGVITAMQEEFDEIKKLIVDYKKEAKYDLTFLIGKINNKNIILTKSAIGKVNASRSTQVLIDNYDVEYIINTGVAGGISNNLNIGDIVISKNVVQYDFDICAFGKEKGFITGIGKFIETNKKLIEKFYKNVSEEFNVELGTVATGDRFCTSIEEKNNIAKEFSADIVEMEAGAIAQVCKFCKIPFIAIKSVSDIPNGNNSISFDKYIKMASKRCAKIVELI